MAILPNCINGAEVCAVPNLWEWINERKLMTKFSSATFEPFSIEDERLG
jgi:hypothetical protein